ncbi:Dabb family protein [Litoribacter ruber]|uniref:Dabb family protein n=1 Tax=Litoribacter ruber TaxID=702568 RepID=A0AAP2G1F4_9BACT|nr:MULTISPECIES: Dabb family protein [Litoribacter]MBS9524077.1 Dabb family protein [Litoribacter alkaliphilus]MBT0811339.1 Dabb family protein [Litoribacter ruber]
MKSRRKFLNRLILALPLSYLPFVGTAQLKAKSRMIHQVFFWLNDDTSFEEFKAATKKLGSIGSVKEFKMGTPAPTEARDVVDSSYDLALNMVFDSLEDQNAYQVDPIHLKFIEQHADKWKEVKVYDFVLE